MCLCRSFSWNRYYADVNPGSHNKLYTDFLCDATFIAWGNYPIDHRCQLHTHDQYLLFIQNEYHTREIVLLQFQYKTCHV